MVKLPCRRLEKKKDFPSGKLQLAGKKCRRNREKQEGEHRRDKTEESEGGVRWHDHPRSTKLYHYVDRILRVVVVIYLHTKVPQGLLVEALRQRPDSQPDILFPEHCSYTRYCTALLLVSIYTALLVRTTAKK